MRVTGKTRIYRKDFDGRAAYSRRIAWQEYKDGQKGDWLGVYETVKMPRGVDIPDGTVINITDAFESGYKKRDGSLIRQLVVMEFEIADEGQEDGFEQIEEKLPF